jgi:TolB-like protein/DNA-binding winged helix-turn-helix (wHTH) protein
MAETQSRPRLVRFGAFEADVRTGELRKNGVKLKFSGQPFQVLAILLERPGDVVTREELQTRLWPDTFVDAERNLNTAVNKIREVLGDSAESPRFVETLPRRGYRFIAEVENPLRAASVDSDGKIACGRMALETALPYAEGSADGAASIAVLPFVNLSDDKEQEYFSDGLSEEIINALARIYSLKVIARTSAFAFRGQNVDIRRIAEALGVNHILEGSVRRAKSRIRVTAQLVTAKDGSHLWSERYDRDIADVFAVQDEIAQSIATALQGRLFPRDRSSARYQPNLAAYEAFLKAQHWIAIPSPEAVSRAKKYLEQAIELDPKFALSYAMLAQIYIDESFYSFLPAQQAASLARAAAHKALALDSSAPDAHAALGMLAALGDYDWMEAEREFRLATAQLPVSPLVWWRRGHSCLRPGGQLLAVEESLKRALKLDPINAFLRFALAISLYVRGQQAEAMAEFSGVQEVEDRFVPVWYWLTRCYATQGMYPEALATAEKAYALTPENSEAIGALAGLLKFMGGEDTRTKGLLAQLGDGQTFGAPLGFATYHFLVGETEQAADWMERAIEQGHFLVPVYLACPLAESLRASARWPALARKMNLPQAGGPDLGSANLA